MVKKKGKKFSFNTKNNIHFVRTFFRSFNPFSYNVLTINNLRKVIIYFIYLILISSVFTIIVNTPGTINLISNVNFDDSLIGEVTSNNNLSLNETNSNFNFKKELSGIRVKGPMDSLVVNGIIRNVSTYSIIFFIVLIPTILFGVLLITIFKYLFFGICVMIISKLLLFLLSYGVRFWTLFKVVVYSMTIFVVFDILSKINFPFAIMIGLIGSIVVSVLAIRKVGFELKDK